MANRLLTSGHFNYLQKVLAILIAGKKEVQISLLSLYDDIQRVVMESSIGLLKKPFPICDPYRPVSGLLPVSIGD